MPNTISPLKETAYEKFHLIPAGELQAATTWDEFEEVVRAYMLPPLTHMHSSAKFSEIEQKSGESVGDYLLRVSKYAKIACGDELPEQIREDLKLRRLLV